MENVIFIILSSIHTLTYQRLPFNLFTQLKTFSLLKVFRRRIDLREKGDFSADYSLLNKVNLRQ